MVDLSDVDFAASMGLRLLVVTARGLGAKDHEMALFGAQPLMQEVLEDAAIDQIIPLAAT